MSNLVFFLCVAWRDAGWRAFVEKMEPDSVGR